MATTKRKAIKTKKKPTVEAKRNYVGETEGKFLMGWHSFLPPRQELNVDSKTGAKIGTNQRLGVITGRMLVERVTPSRSGTRTSRVA